MSNPMDYCKHKKHIPVYDEEHGKTLSAEEVRKRYPRYDGYCSICYKRVILYASPDHYIQGDW